MIEVNEKTITFDVEDRGDAEKLLRIAVRHYLEGGFFNPKNCNAYECVIDMDSIIGDVITSLGEGKTVKELREQA